MRILTVSAQKPDSTGSGIYVRETVRCMVAAGHEAAVLCGVDRNDTPVLPAGVRLFDVRFCTSELPFDVCGMSDTMPYPSTRYRDLTPAMTEQFIHAFSAAITRAISEFKPDVIMCHHLYLVTSLVRELAPGLPVVGLSHSTDLRQLESHALERGRILSAVRQLDAVLALTASQAERIANVCGIDPQRIQVVGTGYNAAIFNAAGPAGAAGTGVSAAGEKVDDKKTDGEKTTGNERPIDIVYAGKIARAKGVASLVAALNQIEPCGDRPLDVCLAGGRGSDEQEYDAIAAAAEQCRHRINLAGRLSQEELADRYRASRVFVLPSFYEGLPLVTIEALACGCKAVATDLPGVRPWMAEFVPTADIAWVEPPRMQTVDEPVPQDLPAFELRLAHALTQALSKEIRPCDITPLSWENTTARILGVLKAAAVGTRL